MRASSRRKKVFSSSLGLKTVTAQAGVMVWTTPLDQGGPAHSEPLPALLRPHLPHALSRYTRQSCASPRVFVPHRAPSSCGFKMGPPFYGACEFPPRWLLSGDVHPPFYAHISRSGEVRQSLSLADGTELACRCVHLTMLSHNPISDNVVCAFRYTTPHSNDQRSAPSIFPWTLISRIPS